MVPVAPPNTTPRGSRGSWAVLEAFSGVSPGWVAPFQVFTTGTSPNDRIEMIREQ
jgi:hypothetical protein